MIIELKPEQAAILERATKSGMSADEVLEQAFAIIEEQLENQDWMMANREAIAAQIEEGFQQAERGELFDPEEAMQILKERRAKRQVA
jgi:predicted transcriptional regulator